jgi:N-acetylglutamate synthase-like GNAT family acetyltransferase
MGASLITRHFRPDDFGAVEAILASYSMYPDLPLAILNKREDVSPSYYVAEENGEVIGGGGIFVIKGPFPVAWLATVAVRKDRKRSGVGRAIVNANLKLAGDRGYGSMWLETFFWNSRFYESLGFEGIKPALLPEKIAAWRSRKNCRVMVNTGCMIKDSTIAA